MTPHHTIRLFALLAVLLAAGIAPARHGDAATRPNVILFLVDDMGWADCGAYGSTYYATPHIDRFATHAMRFTNAYAQPLCSPTRACLLTGKYTSRHGITSATGHLPPQASGHRFLPETAPPNQPMLLSESKNYLEPSEYTLAEALRDAGYRTAHIGKWHLGLAPPYWPERQGFDVAFHCHPDPGPPGGYFSPYGVKPAGEPRGRSPVGTITDGPDGEYIVDRLADEAVRFIEANRDRPFFLNLWNYGVHGPWGHKLEYTRAFQARKDPRGVQGNPIMASMLRSVDECFGRVVETVQRLGLADNTIIIFNSDNGGNTHSNTAEDGLARKRKADDPRLADWRRWAGTQPPTMNTPLRDGKGTLYEGGTRVPLMWSWPGQVRPGTTSEAVVAHIDLYPTLLELLALPRPSQQKIDGASYAAVLRQTGDLQRRALFNYFPHAGVGRAGGVWVRVGDWKLIRWFGVAPGDPARHELYNLRDDLSETKNLAAAQSARVRELDALIDGFLADTGATYPRPNPAYNPALARPATRDPLQGWKARQCDATVKDGLLTMTGKGEPGRAFLGHGAGQTTGPAMVRFRVRTSTGGRGKVEWLPHDAGSSQGIQSVPFDLAGGEWRDVAVDIPAAGPLGIIRLYLPASEKPLELDWVELRGKTPGTNPQRWDFNHP